MGRALAPVRSDPSALILPLTYCVTQDKSLNLSTPHFILKTKFRLSAQTTFVTPVVTHISFYSLDQCSSFFCFFPL